jgi:hypothetical protein
VAVLSLTAFAALVVAAAAFGVTADLGSTVVHDPSATIAAAAPAPAPPPPAPAPAPAPAPTTPAASTATAPATPPPTTPAPAKPAAPAPAATSTTPASTTHTDHHAVKHVPARPVRHHTHGSQPTWQGDQPYSASLYDPAGGGTDEHAGAATRAVDGKVSTAWTSGDHPGGLGKPGVGLVVETGGYQSWSALGIDTATAGFDVSVYSTDQSSPPTAAPDASGSGWRLEGKQKSVTRHQRVAVRGATAQPAYFLVWVTKLPPGKPHVGLSEITLLP